MGVKYLICEFEAQEWSIIMKNMKKSLIIKILIGLVIIALLFIFRDYLNIDYMLGLIQSIQENPFAPVIFVLIYAISVTAIVPAAALTLISAPLFGFWQGLLLTIIGSNLGCHLSYWIAKLLGENTVKKFVKAGSFMEEAKRQIEENGFIFMMYARLIPLFPFAAVNYLSGILGVKYKHYAIATFFGMLPGSAVYVYLGYSVSDISDNPLGIIISIAMLVVFTVIVTIVKKKSGKKTKDDTNIPISPRKHV